MKISPNSGFLGTSGTIVKKVFRAIQRIAIGFACIAAIALGLYLAYLEKVSAASACFTAGIILFLLSNIELFESIKAPGIQATMRKIDDKVREVEELADKVAKTSTVTAEFCMEIMVRIGRFSGPIPREQALALVKNMSNQLLTLGVEQAKVNELLQPWRNMVLFDLLRPAYEHLSERLDQLRLEVERSQHPQMLMDSTEYQHYQERTARVNEWTSRLRSAIDEKGTRRVLSMQAVFQELISSHGIIDFKNHEHVADSLQQADYFSHKAEFLDMKYWLSFDPVAKST